MVKKYFYKMALMFVAFLVVPLYAADDNNVQKKDPKQIKANSLKKQQGDLNNLVSSSQANFSRSSHFTAMTMSNLGNVLSELGEYIVAKKYYYKALEINLQYYGSTHHITATTMGELGIIFQNLGNYKKARAFLQENIEVFTRHYGANHSQTKRVKHNLTLLEAAIAAKSNPQQSKSALEKPLNEEKKNSNDVFDLD